MSNIKIYDLTSSSQFHQRIELNEKECESIVGGKVSSLEDIAKGVGYASSIVSGVGSIAKKLGINFGGKIRVPDGLFNI